jgi:hypothetical protein
MLDSIHVQEQYDIALQQVHNLMYTELQSYGELDERELICELVELYEKIYYPIGED